MAAVARRRLTPWMLGVGAVTFLASAPLKQLVEKFGFTPDAVADVARGVVGR